jgi:hypothetical protein
MEKLNLPLHPLKTRLSSQKKTEIFDEFRKKYIVLTPEEWVRQQFLWYLIEVKKYPASLIALEKGLIINQLQKRFDAVVHNKIGLPIMLLEFKSPDIKLEQNVFDQIASYNMKLRVKYLLISNGLQHYCCSMNYENEKIIFLNEIPNYNEFVE